MTSMRSNIRSSHLLLLQARTQCPECGQRTAVCAIAFPAGHERRDEDEADDAWQRCDARLVVQTFLELRGAAHRLLEELAPLLYQDECVGPWLNHCEHCHHAVEDEDLHGEPGDAFLPMTPRDASAIRVLKIDRECNAVVGTVSFDPPGFEHLGRR